MTPFHVKLLQDLTLKVNFYNSIEQRHPSFPTYEVNVALENMTVTASDYILQSMLRLKDKVLANMNPPENANQHPKGSMIEEVKGDEEEMEMARKMKELNGGESENKIVAANRQSITGAEMVRKVSQKVGGQQQKAAEVVSMNVIVRIGTIELDVYEQIQVDDKEFDPALPSQI